MARVHIPPANTADQLLTCTLYLLSRSATVGVCRGRLRNVIRHLTLLATHTDMTPEMRQMCTRLLVDWQAAQKEHFGAHALKHPGADRLQ